MEIKKKWKKLLAMALVVLMINSVMDYSGFLSVSAENLSETEIQNDTDTQDDTNSVSSDEKSEVSESTVEEPEAQENGTEETTEETTEEAIEESVAGAEDDEASVTDSAGEVITYSRVEDAITAAQSMSGSTVTLLKNKTTYDQVSIQNGTFTIDFNGKIWECLSYTSTAVAFYNQSNVTFKDSSSGGKICCPNNSRVFYIRSGVQVTFEGGIYEAKDDVECIEVQSGTVGELLEEGYAYKKSDGTWATDNDINQEKIGNVTVLPAPVKITAQPEDAVAAPGYTEAPTFNVTAETIPADSGNEITYQWYKNSAAMSGATSASYTAETGLADGTYTYYCAVTCDGYTVNSDNATLYVTSAEGNYEVTSSGGLTFKYPTLETAITAAKSKPNSTVKLLAEATTASKVEVSSGTFTIDLNGKTWTSTASDAALYLEKGSHVTLMDSATGGKLTTSTAQNTIYAVGADLTIKSGIYENENSNYTSYVLVAYFSGTITIQGGTIQTSKSIMNLVYLQSVDVVISGGTFSGPKTAFDACVSVALSGGEYSYISTNNTTIVANLLESGYGFKNKSDNTWVNRIATAGEYTNDLAHTFLKNAVTVERLPIELKKQPTTPESVIYGYLSGPIISVTAEKTDAAPDGSTISYQWYRVKSGSETSDTAVGTNATLTIPTGLDGGTHSFYCVVSCDGYIMNSKSATFTVEKASPTVTFEAIISEGTKFVYGNEICFQATVTGANNQKPDGTVTFRDGSVSINTVDFNSTIQKYSSEGNSFAVGNHSFTAEYTPSTDGTGKNYKSAVSTVMEQVIGKAEQKDFLITAVTGKKYGDADFTLATTGGIDTGAVTYSVPENNGVLSLSGNTASIDGAGEVTVTATKEGDDNYNRATATYKVTIAKAMAPSITYPKAGNLTYGQKLSDSTLNDGDTKYGTFAWADSHIVPSVSNNGYQVNFTPSVLTVKNYEAITNPTSMIEVSVNKATPTIIINSSISDNEGNRSAVLTATVTGVGGGEIPTGTIQFVNCTGENEVDIADGTANISTDGKAVFEWKGLNEQSYKVKAVYKGSDNYNTITSGEFTFDTRKQNQAPLTIDDISSKTYGDPAFILTTTGGSGTGAVTFTSSDPTIVSISGNTATVHKAGAVTIKATKEADENYNDTSAPDCSLIIHKKSLTIKADDKLDVIKGSTMPEFTYTVTGLVDGDTFKNPTISAIADDTGNAANNDTAGKYSITISGGILDNADNYEVTYSKGSLTIVNEYLVTVTNGAVTNGTGGTKYIDGQTVSVTTENRGGYTFTGWTSSDNVSFADSKALTTTFVMPDKDVTVSANFSTDDHYLIDEKTADSFPEGKDKKGYATITLKKTSYVYTGSEIRPVPVVSFTYTEYDDTGKQTSKAKTKKLVENVDYTLSYKTGTVLSLGKILISGIGDYKGTMTQEFTITPKSIKKAVIEPIEDVKATGADLKAYMDGIIIVKDGVNTVSKNDYDIHYLIDSQEQTTLTGSGDAKTIVKVSVTGKNNYKDAIKKTQTFTILPQNSTATSVSDDFTLVLKAPDKSYVYSGKAIKPQITVTSAKGTKVKLNKDYKISYKNNVNAGSNTGTITVSGKNNYYGSKSITFSIQPKEMSKVKVKTLSKLSFRESIEDLELTITDGGRYLKKGEDYTVDFSSSKDLGLGKLKVKKITLSVNAVAGSNYTGSKTVTCSIIPRSLTNKITTKIECSNVTFKESMKTEGAEPVIVIHYNGYQLGDKDFKVTYSNNKKVGTGKAVIQGIGNYTGKRTVKFQITN